MSSTPSQLRLAVVCGRDIHQRESRGFAAALEASFDVDYWHVESCDWMRPGKLAAEAAQPPSAVIYFVKFRHLVAAESIDWGSYGGLRAMYDWDVVQNFSTIVSSRWLGTWPAVVRRHRFDLLICTGGRVADALREQGIDAAWLPKAAEAPSGLQRRPADKSVAMYGQLYEARASLLGWLRRSGLEVPHHSFPYGSLESFLQSCRSVLLCDMQPRSTRPSLSRKLFPRSSFCEGWEPMAKLFEVPAQGAVPIVDRTQDLDRLGYRHLENALVYETFAEARELVAAAVTDTAMIDEISERARLHVEGSHLWIHRMPVLYDMLVSRL